MYRGKGARYGFDDDPESTPLLSPIYGTEDHQISFSEYFELDNSFNGAATEERFRKLFEEYS